MSRIKKIALVSIIVFAAIQLIQPARNKSGQILPSDFTKIYTVPDNVQAVLQNACYDCHANNTKYSWYSNIQPLAWMMARHITYGKEKLNFSNFGSHTTRKRISKLKEIANQVKDDEMPLWSYKMMHKKARLSQGEKTLVIDWILKKTDSLSASN
jgi:cytochrome c551/c552